MAIFSLQCKIIGRGPQKNSGTVSLRTVVAAAAYRAGEKLKNLTDGVVYDFTRKQGVVHSEILLPKDAPEQYRDRAKLWNDIEAMEKRVDAQFCRELVIALPTELSHQENIRLARRFIQKNFVDKGMIADISFHDPNGHWANPHLHVLLTMRDLTPDGEFNKKNREWNNRDNLELWRERWAATCNRWLERAGVEARIDHRSYKNQGVGKTPTIHMGVKATALERKGVRTAKGNMNRAIRAANAARDCGVEQPELLESLGLMRNEVLAKRKGGGNLRTFVPEAALQGQAAERQDTDRTGVQRRTYTLLRNVVRQGQTPAPSEVGKYALRGAESGLSEQKSTVQRLDELRPQQQKTDPVGAALRQPAAASPELCRATTRLTFGQWLLVKLHLKKRSQSSKEHSSLYNLKVMASTLNRLAEDGIGSYQQLEEKLARLESRGLDTGIKLERVDKELARQQKLLGAALRCQANRGVAEQYLNKTLFRENFFKLHREAIETYARSREELRAAGLDEHVTPVQLREQLARLQKQQTGLNSQMEQQRRELDSWRRTWERVENILGGRPVTTRSPEPPRRQPEKKQEVPHHGGRGR